jgi:hypothetical protein
MSTDSSNTRDILREQWWGSLSEIADLALQRRTWLDPKNGNPHWSYVEFGYSYPDPMMLTPKKRRSCLAMKLRYSWISIKRLTTISRHMEITTITRRY